MISVFTLFSGSSGNCTVIKNGDRYALIDAGVSFSALSKALSENGINPERIEAVFLTHEHSDHISGIPVLQKKLPEIKIYSSVGTAKNVNANISTVCEGECVEASGLSFVPFSTPHDAAESFGYTVYENGEKKIGFATDTGYASNSIISGLSGCKTVVIESNHDLAMLMTGRYPYYLKRRIASDVGHLSNEDCAELAKTLYESGTRNFLLAHLSKENNLPELALECTRQSLKSDAFVAVGHINSRSEELNA